MATRRDFLAGASIASLACATRVFGREFSGETPWLPGEALSPDPFDPTRRYLTAQERRFLIAAVDRLIPPDDFPGAADAGVVDFIDGQLAGSFGRGDIFYLAGPFQSGTKSQGYQSREPAWLYRTAIPALQGAVQNRFGASFEALPPEEQDAALGALEDGSLELSDVSGTAFFAMLLQNVKEGYFGDPVHGGNRGMASWRMIGFPGARYDYRPYLDQHGAKLSFEPVSVGGFDIGRGDTP